MAEAIEFSSEEFVDIERARELGERSRGQFHAVFKDETEEHRHDDIDAKTCGVCVRTCSVYFV
jgi:hypothetical protein